MKWPFQHSIMIPGTRTRSGSSHKVLLGSAWEATPLPRAVTLDRKLDLVDAASRAESASNIAYQVRRREVEARIRDGPGWVRTENTPKSNARNRIPGTN
eukprot:1143426-Rhodomonas_salina.1